MFISELCLEITVDAASSYRGNLGLFALKSIKIQSGGISVVEIDNVAIVNRIILQSITNPELYNQYLKPCDEDSNNKVLVYLPVFFNTVGQIGLKQAAPFPVGKLSNSALKIQLIWNTVASTYVTTDSDGSSGSITSCNLLYMEFLSTDALTSSELVQKYPMYGKP